MLRTILWALALFAALPAAAQERQARLLLGGDSYGAGERIEQTAAAPADLFLVGETARATAPVTGTAHLAARFVSVEGPVGGNLYAAGMDVRLTAPVAGNATLAGYDVDVDAPVAGNLRAIGQRVTLRADLGGAALMAGAELYLEAAVAGDALLMSDTIRFGEAARVDGILTIVAEDPEAVAVPPEVAPPERIRREVAQGARRVEAAVPGVSATGMLLGAAATVAGMAVLTALLALIAPRGMAELRARLVQAPARSLWLGFLALSTLSGAGIVAALTLLGILLAPAAILLALAAGLAGYLVGLYALGAGVLVLLGRGEPELPWERILAAAIGALVAALVALLPYAGWILILALLLAGLGALTARLLRPAFFAA